MNNYYKTCHIPKPVDRNKKKKYNGGPNRQISIDEGFQVDLCMACHKEMTDNITPRAKERNDFWKQYYQPEYEDKLIDAGTIKKILATGNSNGANAKAIIDAIY